MKFCCEQFEANYLINAPTETGENSREVFPNIRIVKIREDQFHQGSNPLRFLYVCGFLADKPPFINMKYCPYCGTNLNFFYRSEQYVNQDGEMFF
jgi:hypothetical protein